MKNYIKFRMGNRVQLIPEMNTICLQDTALYALVEAVVQRLKEN